MFGYLRAQLILSGVVLVIVFVALLIFRQPYSLLIAIATGIIDIMPFFGSGAILVPWGVICLLVGNLKKAVFLLILAFALFLFPEIGRTQGGRQPDRPQSPAVANFHLCGHEARRRGRDDPLPHCVYGGHRPVWHGILYSHHSGFRMLFGRVLEHGLPGEAGDSGEDSEGEK